jgi:hypothetical protein
MNRLDSSTLNSITFWLNGYDIAMLWFIGDRKLRYLMSEGRAVTRFETNFDNAHHRLRVAYSRIVDSFLGLKSLSISVLRLFDDDFEYFGASKSLESISVELPRCTALFALLESCPTAFPNLRSFSAIRLNNTLAVAQS